MSREMTAQQFLPARESGTLRTDDLDHAGEANGDFGAIEARAKRIQQFLAISG